MERGTTLVVWVLALGLLACGPAPEAAALDGGPTPGQGGDVQVLAPVAEQEPNNLTTATQLNTLPDLDQASRLTVSGTLSSAGVDAQGRYTGDVDAFAVRLDVAGRLMVDVDWTSTADVDVYVVFNNAAVAQDNGAARPARTALDLQPGNYVVLLASASGTTSYRLDVALQPAAAGAPQIPGGTSTGAGTRINQECTYNSSVGFSDTYAFWADGSYVKSSENHVSGTFGRDHEGSYAVGDGVITFRPAGRQPYTLTYQREDDVHLYMDGSLYLCFDHS